MALVEREGCAEVLVARVDRANDGRREVTFEDVMGLIGMHHRQILIIILTALLWGHATINMIVVTLATESLWAHWPYLEKHPIQFNTVLALCNILRLISSIFVLPLMDRFGRRPFITICFFTSFVLSPLSSASPNFTTFTVIRILTSTCSFPLLASVMIYSFEMVVCTHRTVPAILTQSAGCLNIVLGTVIKEVCEKYFGLERAWRIMIPMVQVIQVISFCIIIYNWLETPRFLAVNRGQTEEAWKTFVLLTPGGEAELRQKLNIPAGIPFKELLKLKGDLSELPPEQRTTRSSVWKIVWTNLESMYVLCATKGNRTNIFWTNVVWALQSFTHWGLASYMTIFYKYMGIKVNYITMASFGAQLVAQIPMYFLMKWPTTGRIGAMKAYLFSCGTVHIILTVLLGLKIENKGALSTLAVLCFFFGGPVWAAIYAYTVESSSTSTRATALALSQAVTSAATVVTTYIGSISLSPRNVWVYPLIWGVLRFVCCACCFFLDYEMNREPLDEREHGDHKEEKYYADSVHSTTANSEPGGEPRGSEHSLSFI